MSNNFFAKEPAPKVVESNEAKTVFSDSSMEAPNFFPAEHEKKAAFVKFDDDGNLIRESKNERKDTESVKSDSKVSSKSDNTPSKRDKPVESGDVPLTKAELRKIAARLGETVYEVPTEARIKHKVDGQEVEVDIQELLNNYAGKTAWDKKFTELGSEKKKYQEELELVNKYVNEFAELSKKDKMAGLVKLAEAVGIDPMQYKKQLRSDLLNAYGDYLKMDENQRMMYEQAEELQYLKGLRESEMKRQQEAQAVAARQQQFSKLQETLGIDEERLDYLSSELKDQYGLDVTPENVQELHVSMVRLDRVDNALKQINPSYIDDLEKVQELESLLRGNSKMTDEQLLKYASKLYGNDVEKAIANLNQKAPAVTEKVKKNKEQNPFKGKVTGNQLNFF